MPQPPKGRITSLLSAKCAIAYKEFDFSVALIELTESTKKKRTGRKPTQTFNYTHIIKADKDKKHRCSYYVPQIGVKIEMRSLYV